MGKVIITLLKSQERCFSTKQSVEPSLNFLVYLRVHCFAGNMYNSLFHQFA
jgi:hypothetical protein